MKTLFTLLIATASVVSSLNADPISDQNVIVVGEPYTPQSRDYLMDEPSSSDSPAPRVPTQECWFEQVPISGAELEQNPNVGGAIVGGVIGGVIGHQFGSGSGKAAATIGGAALGTAIGANSGKRQPPPPQYQLIRKCNTFR